MFNRTYSLTRAVITGSLLALTVAVVDTQATTLTAAQAEQAQAEQAKPQAQATPDTDVAAKIAKAIADDKAVAGYEKTIKIVVSDGLVSLKGTARSEDDKKAIGAKAEAVVGEKNVMNNLVIAPDAPKPQTN